MGQLSSVSFEIAKLANGGDYREIAPGSRLALTTPEQAQVIVELTKAAMASPNEDLAKAIALEKGVTISTGLTAYDLSAPSMLFSPTITPVRNSLKRTMRPSPGNACNWRTINALTNNPNLMGWVPEGRRAASISYSATAVSATYATMGTEDSVTDEAKLAAVGYEDEEALIQMRSLYKLMQIEENALLWGNAGMSLATPAAPTLTSTGSGKTLPTLTYSVIVVALTGEGYQNASLTGGVMTPQSITSNDGQGAFTVNGGSSAQSAAATQAIVLGAQLNCTVTAIAGAVAYAWYVGAAGAEKLEAITTVNSAVFSAPLAGTHQAATAISANWSLNTTAYDGLITQAFRSSTAYRATLATGTAGAGTQLTSVGDGEVTEIRTMLQTMWDNYRVSISKLYVSSQELTSLTKLVLANGSSPLIRMNTSATTGAPGEVRYTAGAVVGWYFNPYGADGGRFIPIIIHPNMVPGTVFGYAENLPPTYMSNETPSVAELLVRQDYYVEKWARTARAQFYGTYCQSVPAVFAQFCMATIGNIAPTT